MSDIPRHHVTSVLTIVAAGIAIVLSRRVR